MNWKGSGRRHFHRLIEIVFQFPEETLEKYETVGISGVRPKFERNISKMNQNCYLRNEFCSLSYSIIHYHGMHTWSIQKFPKHINKIQISGTFGFTRTLRLTKDTNSVA
jgi:hypothetical protein